MIQKPSQRFLDNTNEFRRKTIDAPVVIVAHGDLVKALTRFKKITGESLDELRRHREFLPKSVRARNKSHAARRRVKAAKD